MAQQDDTLNYIVRWLSSRRVRLSDIHTHSTHVLWLAPAHLSGFGSASLLTNQTSCERLAYILATISATTSSDTDKERQKAGGDKQMQKKEEEKIERNEESKKKTIQEALKLTGKRKQEGWKLKGTDSDFQIGFGR